jgi:uncharacterized membrane protein SpoIIM required for sporulation
MNLSTFITKRRADWRRLEEVLRRVEGSGLGSLDEDQAVEFGRLYRRAASDLNQAQTFVSGDATVQYLNDLVARCYLVIYAKTTGTGPRAFFHYLTWGFPPVFRRQLRPVLLATAITVAGALFGFLVSYWDPVSRSFLLPSDFPTIQPSEVGEDVAPAASTGELAAFSSLLFRNNMSVSLTVFALGITFGIGTAWLLWYNGILMGVLAAVFLQAGQFRAFLTGVLPHGVLEIPAILIAGGAGFLLAQGLIQARPWPRVQELARTGKEALLLVAGCFPLLVVAAVLEAVVARAPDRYLASGFKLAVATLFAALFVIYVFLLGWKKPDLTTSQ